jgi:hypothetical protein
MLNPQKDNGHSPVMIPQGQVLIDLAGEYKTIGEVVFELVANALDAEATAVMVVINKKKRNITVADNGKGMSKAGFDKAFASVRRSMKDRSKFGQHGLGFISALGKCELARYISRSKSQGGEYLQYTLETEAVRTQDEQVLVPHKVRSDIVHKSGSRSAPQDAKVVDWYTLVEIQKYTKDRFIANLGSAQSIADGIEERYGVGMLKVGARVTVLIADEQGNEEKAVATGKRFTGRRLGMATLKKPQAGETIIDLYLARKSSRGKLGKIVVGRTDNDFRFPLVEMLRSAPGILPEEAAKGLLSGIFEGEILLEHPERLKNRKGFEVNEPFVEACVAIEEWFNNHGKQHLDEEKELRNGERYQMLGELLLKNIEGIPILADAVKNFELGTVGDGHFDSDKLKPVGKQPHKSVSIEGTDKRGSGNSSGGGEGGGEPASERDTHYPLTAAGPRGKRRTIVRKGSTGLQIAHDELPGSARRWELDPKQGILTFNVRHPDWLELEGDKRKIMQYQEIITSHVLVILVIPDDWNKDSVELALELLVTQHVHQIKYSESFNLKAKLSKA